MSTTVLTDDLDMNGHHLRDWRYLGDIPQGGATTGQALVWSGTAWAPATLTSGTVAPVDSVFGRTGAVVAAADDYTVDQIADADAATQVDWISTTLSLAELRLRYVIGDYITLVFAFSDDTELAYLRYNYDTDRIELSNYTVVPSLAVAGVAYVDTVNEYTAAAGVTVDGVLLKDSQVSTDQINEKTAAAGVTVDTMLIKDGVPYTNTVSEATSGSGVTVDSLLIKDGVAAITDAFQITIDGGGATITTGVKGDYYVPFKMTITGWTLLADQSGSIAIDVWRDTYANYPPTDPDSAVTPSITTSTKAQGSSLSITCNAGDTLRFNVDSVTTIQRVTLALTGVRAA